MRRVIMLGLLTTLVWALIAFPAGAKGKDEAPAQICKELDNTFPPDGTRPFPLVIQSDGGCASSVAQGFPDSYVLSGSAFNAQCKFLEGGVMMGDEYFQLTYPYSFYGNPAYTAKNRADCHYFLSAFHYGLLPPGPGGS